jgi:hypothetical protein
MFFFCSNYYRKDLKNAGLHKRLAHVMEEAWLHMDGHFFVQKY